MNSEKKQAIDEVIKNAEKIADAAKAIFGFAELSLEEYKSCDYYCTVLEKEGFKVEKGICNIPTAFSASFGSGKPVIGLMAEYDALSGLSQEPACLEHKEIVPGGTGHGCGHNLLGAGCFGAALGIKKYLETTGKSGTVIMYGCPGEEGGAAKAFMARDGEWKKLDVAFAWHPNDNNEVSTGSSNSCIQKQYTFYGKASHASGSPDRGRSALDAVELMNIGVQFIREHMASTARIHYAITDTGGRSPNVVQAKATVLYMVRSIEVSDCVALQERVDKIAQGAALMTETTLETKFIDGLANVVTNHTLEKLVYENMKHVVDTTYTDEEIEFANKLAKTYVGCDDVTSIAAKASQEMKYEVASMKKKGQYLNDFIAPLYLGDYNMPSSTDCGDVSWLCPFVTFYCTTRSNNTPSHSWQNVSFSGHSIGFKGAVNAAKVMTASAIDLIENPAMLEEARKEFEKRTQSGYCCPIPKDAVPTIAD